MPRPSGRKVLRIPFRPSETEKDPEGDGSLVLKPKGVNIMRRRVPTIEGPIKSEEPKHLPSKVFGVRSDKNRIVDSTPLRPRTTSQGKASLKSKDILGAHMPKQATSLILKKVNSNIVTDTFVQKERMASQFLSVTTSKGRIIKHKVITPSLLRKTESNFTETHRLSHEQMLKLLEALLKEPLHFLELHGRFGVTKATITKLVRKGLLTEVWGSKAVGLKFELSAKGKIYLNQLEAAARYEPKLRKNAIIRLKQRANL